MVNENIIMKDAHIIFRNFSGKAGKYNREGVRSFSAVVDDPELAAQLIRDGWNLKPMKMRDETDTPRWHIQVAVSYDHIPPKIYSVINGVKTLMDEDSVGELDYAEMKTVKLEIRPYNWEVNGKTGVKAYVKTMYVYLDADPFTEDDDLPF